MTRTIESNIDWEALRSRLGEARAALDRTDQISAESTRSILERRATRLAEPIAPDVKGNSYEAITFRLGSEIYAIDASVVVNVFRLGDLALLPGARAPVHGVTMWRGEVLTLLDLRASLGMSTGALTDLGRVIVIGRGRAAFGLLADSVNGVRAIGRDEVHASTGRTRGRNPLVSGITSDAILVLDGRAVLRLANTGA